MDTLLRCITIYEFTTMYIYKYLCEFLIVYPTILYISNKINSSPYRVFLIYIYKYIY